MKLEMRKVNGKSGSAEFIRCFAFVRGTSAATLLIEFGYHPTTASRWADTGWWTNFFMACKLKRPDRFVHQLFILSGPPCAWKWKL